MRAAIVEAPRKCGVTEIEAPALEPYEVRVRLEGTGICASDLPVWEGRPWFDYPRAPGAPGHESWGVVEAIGSRSADVEPGDRVAAFALNTYADCAIAKVSDLVSLPPALDRKPFPGEPLACAVNAFERCGISGGDTVATVGAGFQGLLLTQLASAAGATVVAISRRPCALKLAEQCGARGTVQLADPGKALREAMQFTAGHGFDRVIECTGKQEPLALAGELVRERGRLIIVGYHQDPRQVNMQLWNWRGIDVINAHERDICRYVDGMRRAVRAVETGLLNPWPLMTHTFPLEELGRALDLACERPAGFATIQL